MVNSFVMKASFDKLNQNGLKIDIQKEEKTNELFLKLQ